ncbi:hypothetical protein ESCNG_40042 [Neisseria gonorrhoeae]|nr:hypothetical protein ESCNG_40042 [Neisseria gonorrhoeae]SCW20547.1 hypothetical protein ESCNG_90029 [Neisseria gonorrhoeae]
MPNLNRQFSLPPYLVPEQGSVTRLIKFKQNINIKSFAIYIYPIFG